MGCNRPAEAMPFDGMVRRYFNNLLLPICELTHTRLLNTTEPQLVGFLRFNSEKSVHRT